MLHDHRALARLNDRLCRNRADAPGETRADAPAPELPSVAELIARIDAALAARDRR